MSADPVMIDLNRHLSTEEDATKRWDAILETAQTETYKEADELSWWEEYFEAHGLGKYYFLPKIFHTAWQDMSSTVPLAFSAREIVEDAAQELAERRFSE